MSSCTPLARCPAVTISFAISFTRSALRAARSTYAPQSARRRAMASPMPRDAPVTSAVFPLRSMRIGKPLNRLDVRHVHQLDRRVDALDQTREHVARSDFHDPPHTHGNHPLHRLDPTHWRGDLAQQRVAHRGGRSDRRRVDVRYQRYPQIVDRRIVENRPELFFSGFHQLAMK